MPSDLVRPIERGSFKLRRIAHPQVLARTALSRHVGDYPLIGQTVMTNRERNTKAGILAAAGEVLAERGLPGMTFDRIAKRANCAKGLVNYHFPSRVTLLVALVSQVTEGLWTGRIQGLSQPGTGIVDETWKVLLAERGRSVQLALSGLASMRSDAQIDRAFRLNGETNMRRWTAGTEAWLKRSRFRTDSQDDVARAAAALLDGFASRLTTDDPDELYSAYLTAWLGLIAALSASRD